jgi:malate permease and related proteins
MSETGIISTQIFILAVAVLVGVIASKTRIITKESNGFLSKVIFNISLPLMLFTNFFKLDITPKLLYNSLIVISISAVVILFLLLVGWVTTKIIKMPVREAAVFKAHSMFGNIIFLGFPLITALYGKEGLLYASMFQLVSNIMMWTIGVVVLSQGNGTPWQKSIKKVFNPNTIATLTGLTCFMFSLKLPEIIISPLSGIGSTNTWLCMIYIGAMMSYSNVRGLLGKKIIYVLSFNRLILVPIIVIFTFYAIKVFAGISVDILVSSVIIMEIAMPCMASVVIMSKELDADDSLAMANVFISTFISLITLPLIVLIINMVL